MKTDIQTSNENVTPNRRELLLLKKFFPQCFSKPDTDENGNIIKEHFDIEKLTDLLNKDDVDIKKEGFTLNFLGKSYAHYQSNLDSETVIVPDEKNAETDSENVYIVGDNLDALQHLKYSYAEKVKCIYIDPPYNTGKDDFIYNDKFGFTAKELVEKLDVSEEEAERICGMNGKCTHSAWLTFMYPRLALARELLREDGVIFISIDDNEQANLKRLCDEVFGEGNFVGTFTVKSTPNARDYGHIGKMHEYVLFYTKRIEKAETFLIKEKEKKFKFSDETSGFNVHPLYNSNEAFTNQNRPNLYYPFYLYPETKNGCFFEIGLEKRKNAIEIYPPKSVKNNIQFVWRWGKDKAAKYMNQEIIGYITEENEYRIVQKMRHSAKLIRSIIDNKEITSRKGTEEVEELLGGKIFSFPKPVALIQALLDAGIEDEGIVLDFFSGSGTTAEAVMKKNISDKNFDSCIKYILVQIDEDFDELKHKTTKRSEQEKYDNIIKFLDSIDKPHKLSEIGRERIRRAAAKIKAEHPGTTADLGFKTYYLKSMPKETLDKIKDFDPNALISSDGNIVKSLGETTILQTWQIKDGFGFNITSHKIDLVGYTAYLLEDEKIGKYLYLLDEIEEKSIKELIRKIESMELTVDKIFIYGYSFDFNMLTSITTNLKTLKNRNPIEPIVRY